MSCEMYTSYFGAERILVIKNENMNVIEAAMQMNITYQIECISRTIIETSMLRVIIGP